MTVGNVSAIGATAPLFVTQLAAKRADWASTRQAAIAGNIANADTPGYKARDIAPFKPGMAFTERLQMAATAPQHMTVPELALRAEEVREADALDVEHSANTVTLDAELMKADETARGHQLAVSVMGTYYRMMMSAVSFR
ncbi:flagellar basal body protein [Acuticoccus sp. MNP-M23]|uniref:flagellar basal body protein n=1 Tax=Acuticoccus sp. MNP-M23 TaxID=3072793 RepID=UPI002815908C|nr:flagellar basal body protein [Acuticoccus sp. MNP-M23]WMS41798.1 flagellar basal body protein [Acuticoccus sp. MNP-M23]